MPILTAVLSIRSSNIIHTNLDHYPNNDDALHPSIVNPQMLQLQASAFPSASGRNHSTRAGAVAKDSVATKSLRCFVSKQMGGDPKKGDFLPETNRAQFFRGYVSFREGIQSVNDQVV